MPVRFRDAAFRAGAVRRVRVAAAFFPAAIRFGDLRDVVRDRVVAALRAAVVRRFRVVAALRADVVRFRVAAAFFPAAIRLGDFRVVLVREVVRLRVAAAFFPAAIRFGDFRVVLVREVDRFRVAAAFFPAAIRFGDFRVDRFRAGAFEARDDAVLRFVAGRDRSPPGGEVGAAGGITVVSIRGVGRSHAGVSGCQEGSGALGESSVERSWSSRSCVASEPPSRSSQGQSLVLRSGGVMRRSPPARVGRSTDAVARTRTRSRYPYPDSERSTHAPTEA